MRPAHARRRAAPWLCAALGAALGSLAAPDARAAQPDAGAALPLEPSAAGEPGAEHAPEPSERAEAAAAANADVSLPELIQRSDPEYPPAARAAGLEATVVLHLELDAEGRVLRAEVPEPVGHGFDEAALRAAHGLRFSPARRAGRAIAARISFKYEFALEVSPVASSGALAGEVRTANGQMPLEGARLVLRSGGQSVAERRSDARGSFQIGELSPGDYEVSVSGAGFVPQTQALRVVPGEEALVQLVLVPAPPASPVIEVTVQGERVAPRAVTYRKLERRELARVAGNRGDALAALENLPGVARPPALSGLLIVRGTAPQSTQIFVDGTYVPNMYHFGGITSVLPTDMLDHLRRQRQSGAGHQREGPPGARPQRAPLRWRLRLQRPRHRRLRQHLPEPLRHRQQRRAEHDPAPLPAHRPTLRRAPMPGLSALAAPRVEQYRARSGSRAPGRHTPERNRVGQVLRRRRAQRRRSAHQRSRQRAEPRLLRQLEATPASHRRARPRLGRGAG